jgi:hypothetical protein
VRSKYKVPTQDLDDQFIQNLHYKSGYPTEGITEIVSFIRYLQAGTDVSEEQLARFHRQLETFYQNT